ncbi:MAG: family 16 glycosylhydrolase [Breznakibacter sp.]
MKKTIVTGMVLLVTLFCNAQEYTLVWEDDFNSPVLNEMQHWTVEVDGNGSGNNEMQYYRRENVTIEPHPSGANCLVLSAKRENYLGKVATSGRLVTHNKISCRYGKIEARIHLPETANGLWPAFWMMGEDYPTAGWPKCGEIDILEMGNSYGIQTGTQDRYFNGACHWGESWNNGAYPNYAQSATWATSLQDDFHLFTLIWDETSIKMYVDLDKTPNVQPYFVMNIAGQDVAGNVGRYFHKPFFILLNLAVGGNFTGITGNSNINKITALPADGTPIKMWVDYVRIYQKGNSNELYSGPALSTNVSEHGASAGIFPNPTKGELNVAALQPLNHVAIYSNAGRLLKTIHSPSAQLDVSSLDSGLYLLKLVYLDKSTEILKFTKL